VNLPGSGNGSTNGPGGEATASDAFPPTPAVAPTASGAVVTPVPSLARIDPTLLSVLPATIAGGLQVKELRDAEQSAAADVYLGRNVARVATAFVVDPSGANWAYTSIVDVRPTAANDVFL